MRVLRAIWYGFMLTLSMCLVSLAIETREVVGIIVALALLSFVAGIVMEASKQEIPPRND